jgi:hypothetical protein
VKGTEVIEIIKYHKSFLQPYEYVVLKSVAEARDAAEAKLAKAVGIIKAILFTAHADDYAAWDSALDDATDLIAELEKTE